MGRKGLAIFALVVTLLVTSIVPTAFAEEKDNITIVLIGVDSADDTAEDADDADIVLIASLNLSSGIFKMINIQRDLLVELPDGNGVGKLCTATSLGDPSMALTVVNSLLSLNIAYYARVDMAGLEKIMDSLDSIDVDVSENELDMLMPDGKSTIFQKPGIQTLNANQVMAYIKSPIIIENTSRSDRLGKVLYACMKKSMNLDMGSMIDLVNELLSYIETNMSLEDLLSLAFSALSVDFAGFEATHFPQKMNRELLSNTKAVLAENYSEEVASVHAFLYGAKQIP